ncbi:RagB/SusD family nutrient uptake outer membrane protein [Paraflavitalea speifideaquila]|uniref:RagB/SusD family nutrient uptake outer membrane protein n=1 Tax=Paraflavitalea speifideaquila TaxID=3076558 RepID=UPI0028F099E5|nr:RagB/SusD family nutrient uptake outer membrane protein [Paraflavitalea speifideiaquila]
MINNNALYDLLPSLNNVFLKNSREAIWQIQPADIDFNTREGQTLVIPPTGPSIVGTDNPVYLSDHLLNSFEANDQRAVYGNWLDTTIYPITTTPLVLDTVIYPYKYKINASPGVNTIDGLQEYFMVLRLAELYLIRAEARALQNKIVEAQSDLNAIRTRAGLATTTANDQASLLTAILHERQVELFSEWGHRWFDLKRTGKIDAVMSVVTPQKANGAPWQSYQQWFPLPVTDLLISPNMTQNAGY